jgi:inner membrane protein
MTGRTHDLAAFTALNIVFLIKHPIPDITFATTITALGANMLGGLAPDIDDATADFWDKIRGGHVLARLVKPFVGKHRKLSHSFLGMIIFAILLEIILSWMGTFLLVDMDIVWWSVMIGFVSHLITDGMTTQGVPLLFPIPIHFGFPPFSFMRMRTNGFVEKWIVFPGLILLNGYFVYVNYDKYLELFRGFF